MLFVEETAVDDSKLCVVEVLDLTKEWPPEIEYFRRCRLFRFIDRPLLQRTIEVGKFARTLRRGIFQQVVERNLLFEKSTTCVVWELQVQTRRR